MLLACTPFIVRFSVSLRRAAAFPVISLLIQFVGQTLCLLGHWRRHQPIIVVVAAFLYVLAGARYNCLVSCTPICAEVY